VKSGQNFLSHKNKINHHMSKQLTQLARAFDNAITHRNGFELANLLFDTLDEQSALSKRWVATLNVNGITNNVQQSVNSEENQKLITPILHSLLNIVNGKAEETYESVAKVFK
jgi:hypothetical protein